MKNTSAQLKKDKSAAYELNQCALYKINSKSKLAKIINTSLSNILLLSESKNNYRVFNLEESVCDFTGKKTNARVVQEPIKSLKDIHTRIQKLLRKVISPDYAHASIKGRSYRSNAVAHMENERVATFDVSKFYPSTSKSRVFDFFRYKLLCSSDVSSVLSNLLCYENSLPTGSPSSPIIALYANNPMFEELNKLAIEFSLTFTCYVDDLTFSGKMIPRNLDKLVKNILTKHGHKINEKKTQIFKKNQYKRITGVIVYNGSIFVPHQRFLKARAISLAISNESLSSKKITLARKLSGLLGEAAYLDKRYSNRAKKSYVELKKLIAEE